MTSDRFEGAGLSGTDVGQLKRQAKSLLRWSRDGDEEVLDLLMRFHPRGAELATDPAQLTLADAQLALARYHGFGSWPRLRAHLRSTEPWKRAPHRARRSRDPVEELLRLGCLTYGADDRDRPRQAAAMLSTRPELSEASVHTAAVTGDVRALRRLLDADAGLVAAEDGPHRWPPLLYLCFGRIADDPPARSALDAANVLLAAGADPNAGFLWEGLAPPFTALTGVFGGGEDAPNQPPHPYASDLARMLLDAGADPNDGQTLYDRMFGDDDDHLELLFSYGLGRGDGGPWRHRLGQAQQSPGTMLADQLLWAVGAGRIARVRLLLRNGVDPNHPGSGHPTHHGRTAYETALRNGSQEIADLLTAAGASPPQEPLDAPDRLLSALLAGDVEAADSADPQLLAQARTRHADAVGTAVGLRRPSAVRLLVAAGFDIDGSGPPSRVTPLHQAAFTGDLEMVRLLVGLGADPARTDPEHHSTPQGWAEHGHHDAVASFLAQQRAGN